MTISYSLEVAIAGVMVHRHQLDGRDAQPRQMINKVLDLERQIQAQQAALDSSARELDASKQTLKECQGRERKAADEAAELRGQLKSSMEIQTRGTTKKT